jgi:lysophospholipase
MTGIAALSRVPLAVPLAWVLKLLMGGAYVFGGGDWSPDERADPARNIFSHDPVRAAVHNAWCLANPSLQVGNVTFGWVYAALKSCAALRHDLRRAALDIPCLFALAGDEKLVDNHTTRVLAAKIKSAHILDLPGAYHEILMEKDEIRGLFWSAFENMLKTNNIRDQLKPF